MFNRVNWAKTRNAVNSGNFVIFHVILVFKFAIESILPTFISNTDSKYVLRAQHTV